MNLKQAQEHMDPGIDYKAVMQLIPPLIALADPFYKPSHMAMGLKMGFMEPDFDNPTLVFKPKDPKNFRACVVRLRNGEIVLNGNSTDYPETMPTHEELSSTLRGEIQFLYEE